MNNIKKQMEEKKRQMARVTFAKRRQKGKYAVYLDKKKIGYYHLVSLKNFKTHTGSYTNSINENTHYWSFVDERTDPAYRRINSISMFYSSEKEHHNIQYKIASLVPFPLPVHTEEEKKEIAEWREMGNKFINMVMNKEEE